MAYGKAGDWYVNNVEGGGGSSDFSTAKVTIKSNATNEIICGLAVAQEADPPFMEHSLAVSILHLYENDENTYRAILYKGMCELSVRGANSINGSGGVDVLNNTGANITGDCTITIS